MTGHHTVTPELLSSVRVKYVQFLHFYITFYITLQLTQFNFSSKSEVLSLSTTPTPVVLVLAISLVINFLVGLGLLKQLATAEERKEMALYGKDWVKKVLALSAKRKQTKISSKKETVETKDKQNIDDGQDWPWSSDFFDKFISSEFNLDWVPSHVKTSSAFN